MRTFTTIFVQDLAETTYRCEPEIKSIDNETNEASGTCTLVHKNRLIDVEFEITFNWSATLNPETGSFANIEYEDGLGEAVISFNDDDVMIFDTEEDIFISDFQASHYDILIETIESTDWVEELADLA